MRARKPAPVRNESAFASRRRDFIKQASLLAVGAAACGVLPWTTASSFAQEEWFPVVETTYGKLRGQNVAGIQTFKGIHYGGTTAGKNRFMPPTKPAKWSGVRDALAHGQRAPQSPLAVSAPDPRSDYTQMRGSDLDPGGMGEDCLVLNVYTPGLNDGARRPVFVSLHGGGFNRGSGNGTYGDPLARFGDAVVVTVNHRLGALGYLHLGDIGGSKYKYSGVAGMMDLVAALEWVRDNIETFGGDPNRVMIFGLSGGGSKTSTLLAMPSAKGLFHRAAVQSGARLTMTEPEAATRGAETFLHELGISRRNLDEIQNVPWDRILSVQWGQYGPIEQYGPIADGTVIPRHPFEPTAPEVSADVPLIVGFTREDSAIRRGPGGVEDEMGLKQWAQETFSGNTERVLSIYRSMYPNATPHQIQARILTDRNQRPRATTMVERKAALGQAPAYFYLWTWPSPAYGGKYGALHGVDQGLALHNARNMIDGCNSPEGLKMADILASVWVAFARTGDPNCDAVPAWPAYNTETRPTMIFDAECRVENDPGGVLRRFWQEIGV